MIYRPALGQNGRKFNAVMDFAIFFIDLRSNGLC